MKFSIASIPFVLLLSFLSFTAATEFSAGESDYKFLKCLKNYAQNPISISKLIYTPLNSTYNDALLYSINNLRFAKPEVAKPLAIITPTDDSQIQTTIYCCKKHGIEMRIRSGGHNFEGLSYVSPLKFIVLDLRNFAQIKVDKKTATAWIDSGVTTGELYYGIVKATSEYGFPSGLWANIGVGGIFSGGGYGMMRRKYGLAADNVIDARLIDANGRILTRKTMGEDWFWAIRGGGGGSFGVVVSWQVKLVPVPKIVTIFRITRTLEQNLTSIFHKWQSVVPKFPYELDIRCTGQTATSPASPRADNKTVGMLFESLYLGGADDMLAILQERFPELGVVREDCLEVNWGQAMQFFSNFDVNLPLEILLNKTVLPRFAFKGRTDFTTVPISVQGLEGVWEKMFELPVGQATLQFTPYGGKMDEISESALPFPYRKGTLYMFHMFVLTNVNETERMAWIKSLGDYLTPHVNSNPRSAYVNYVNLWLGSNNPTGTTSYAQASKWGKQYFRNNFKRLVFVKTIVDPGNFFRHEQSIPTFSLFSNMYDRLVDALDSF